MLRRRYSPRQRESRVKRKLFSSSSAWVRWGALAAGLAGVLSIVGNYLLLTYPENLSLVTVLLAVSSFFVLLGLTGFHALQKERYERLGRGAFYLLVAAYVAQILGVAVLSVDQAIWWLHWIGAVGALVGYVLYGTATTRAGVLPRWCGEAFIVAYSVATVLPGYGGILFGLIWLALGYALWSRRNTVAGEQPTRAH